MMVMGQIGAGVLEVAKRCPSAFPFFKIYYLLEEKKRRRKEREAGHLHAADLCRCSMSEAGEIPPPRTSMGAFGGGVEGIGCEGGGHLLRWWGESIGCDLRHKKNEIRRTKNGTPPFAHFPAPASFPTWT